MSLDASFEKIQSVSRHPNADKLDIAIVSGYKVVCGKDEFSAGDYVLYIRDDAKLLGYDELKEWENRDKGEVNDGDFASQESFSCTFKWQEPLLKYLGGGGRVKTIRLRGEYSSGIIVDLKRIFGEDNKVTEEYLKSLNEKIMFEPSVEDVMNGNSESGEKFLEDNFGISHWTMPCNSMGQLGARGQLVWGLQKTDEENFQNINDEDIPYGEEVLITKKLDGTSCSIAADVNGDVHVMSRSLDLILENDNVYTKASKEIIPMVVALSKHLNQKVVLRGEVTGSGINTSSVNKDAVGEPKFNLFGCVFPEQTEYEKRTGMLGTEYHFLEIKKILKDKFGYEILTVPVLGYETLTRELLEKFALMPASAGEGVVINTRNNRCPHFKSKSKDYLTKIG